jgi:hypothetical protein
MKDEEIAKKIIEELNKATGKHYIVTGKIKGKNKTTFIFDEEKNQGDDKKYEG